jgi:hypothetical protein
MAEYNMLGDWMAFESLNIVCGDHLLCPLCQIGILNQDRSGAYLCDICDAEFSIEE